MLIQTKITFQIDIVNLKSIKYDFVIKMATHIFGKCIKTRDSKSLQKHTFRKIIMLDLQRQRLITTVFTIFQQRCVKNVVIHTGSSQIQGEVVEVKWNKHRNVVKSFYALMFLFVCFVVVVDVVVVDNFDIVYKIYSSLVYGALHRILVKNALSRPQSWKILALSNSNT